MLPCVLIPTQDAQHSNPRLPCVKFHNNIPLRSTHTYFFFFLSLFFLSEPEYIPVPIPIPKFEGVANPEYTGIGATTPPAPPGLTIPLATSAA